MIRLEHAVLASPEQMDFIIEGMRNPMNSWEKSDSFYGRKPMTNIFNPITEEAYMIGKNDGDLMQRLSNAGTDHRKFMRMMPVYVRITAPLYWWKEFDTYKVGTVANSCSTMHKIQAKEFTLDDFSNEHILNGMHSDVWINEDAFDGPLCPEEVLYDVICILNKCRDKYLETSDKRYWWQMIQLLPSSYNQTRNVMMNYEVLSNIYKSRSGHKLDEWREFCQWIETLPYSELMIG